MVNLPLIDRKPAVQILAQEGDDSLDPVLWGLEEEQIPAQVEIASDGDAEALAFRAAHMSALNVGIGLDAGRHKAALHHRDLPAGRPLFKLEGAAMGSAALRRLGLNAARLAKGDPLSFAESEAATPTRPDAGGSPDLVERIVRDVLDQLLKR